ncbi:MAG: McrC family protein [Leptospirales bacterium]
MRVLTICEFDRLVCDPGVVGPDCHCVPVQDFDWLRGHRDGMGLARAAGLLATEGRSTTLLQITERKGRPALRAINYAGVLQTPGGLILEILPKTYDRRDDPELIAKWRGVLIRMLAAAGPLPIRAAFDHTSLQSIPGNLPDTLIKRFLDATASATRSGLGENYIRRRERSESLRGRIDMQRQMRDHQTGVHRLHIEYDELSANTSENRLLRSALERVRTMPSLSGDAQKSLSELLFYFKDISASANQAADFRRWRDDRGRPKHARLRQWCELILSGERPAYMRGAAPGISLMFPVERLFEAYFAAWIRRRLPPDARLRVGDTSIHLARFAPSNSEARDCFVLKPDFIVSRAGRPLAVLDTKWKRLKSGTANHGLSREDLYQIFAYSHRYFVESGECLLVYPASPAFPECAGPYVLGEGRRLWIAPFDPFHDTLKLPSELLSGSDSVWSQITGAAAL